MVMSTVLEKILSFWFSACCELGRRMADYILGLGLKTSHLHRMVEGKVLDTKC